MWIRDLGEGGGVLGGLGGLLYCGTFCTSGSVGHEWFPSLTGADLNLGLSSTIVVECLHELFLQIC